eukprot:c2633_g1_i1.p1 GENE.c2633_g1_i1~~c2633_g1_i1.p1  ORF type:complete len:207 (+),score=68.85 c2633_g1_i1:46-666(+)
MSDAKKFVLIGESGVGKTALLTKAANHSDNIRELTATVGLDMKMLKVQLGSGTVRLQVWDTAGQERYTTITQNFFRGSQAFGLVYDVTNVSSFERVQSRWLQLLREGGYGDIPIVLIGNKCDLLNRQVTTEQGQELANQLNIPFLETSALTGDNVQEFFVAAALLVTKEPEQKSHSPTIPPQRISLVPPPMQPPVPQQPQKQQSCC